MDSKSQVLHGIRSLLAARGDLCLLLPQVPQVHSRALFVSHHGSQLVTPLCLASSLPLLLLLALSCLGLALLPQWRGLFTTPTRERERSRNASVNAQTTTLLQLVRGTSALTPISDEPVVVPQ
jgi:hypothetical protein